jgi:hypothetical protein
MAKAAGTVLKRIWRGTLRPRPVFPSPANPKWYNYAAYWATRPRDYIVAAFVPLIPLVWVFLWCSKKPIHPVLMTVQVGIWVSALLLAYSSGGDSPRGRGRR